MKEFKMLNTPHELAKEREEAYKWLAKYSKRTIADLKPYNLSYERSLKCISRFSRSLMCKNLMFLLPHRNLLQKVVMCDLQLWEFLYVNISIK